MAMGVPPLIRCRHVGALESAADAALEMDFVGQRGKFALTSTTL